LPTDHAGSGRLGCLGSAAVLISRQSVRSCDARYYAGLRISIMGRQWLIGGRRSSGAVVLPVTSESSGRTAEAVTDSRRKRLLLASTCS